ncbi:MAG: addiction module protein [Chloroflexi bacterium]|nr:addiction module protein [Chloroflexota bacterium]
MTTRKDDLEVEVLSLPTEDRAELARRLIESLEESGIGDFEAEWMEEAERRYAAYRRGLSTGRPGREVFQEAKARLE